ncbi:anthranilate synthase component II [Desulfallas thermosapovorans]|uniref:Anthranilate synthase component 2/para-aminobenzoate synthetase component 2 n=1 Tax=Desulfallas thermosapovorans DSM 6562 TaxID=1121431 RepID=A0A5S4ZY28_9FIRM|nr:aminodeoxychorismate/anthranilate synthase component II [Desulfallas thermosapovorans]TYO97994.1 anthranilate synthase component 2/para-aminobenzoate synthetase component 2 [Desulfallas thermosapovorans DSM 6562]
MILLIDNYDSFVYNLYQYLCELGQEVEVYRNDKITPEEIEALSPQCIVLSPGPCSPDEAGISLEVVRRMAGKIPIFGVCLGHQTIGQALGGKVVRAPRLMHGKTSRVFHDGRGIYAGLPNPMAVARYHSLILERESLPECLEVTAVTARGEIMGVRHRHLPVEGVQFHPESILTTFGKKIMSNYLNSIEGGMGHAG